MNHIEFLTVDYILHLHAKAMQLCGGVRFGVRDKGLLESAVFQPQVMLFGEYAHKSLYEMAAAYSYHIVKNHPFVDGNKRTGFLAAVTFLEANGIQFNASDAMTYRIMLDLASSKIDKDVLANFFKKYSIEINQ